MNVDFSSIQHDVLGNLVHPEIVLKTLDEKVIGVIGDYFGLKMELKFIEPSEIQFSVPAYDDGKKNPWFEEVQAFRMVQIDPFGKFILEEPETDGDGVTEVKRVSAKSLEYKLASKDFVLEEGTYQLYRADDLVSDNPSTIMGIVHQVAPDWSVAVDHSLWNRCRTFSDTNKKLLDWLANDAAKSFGCLFNFDSTTKTVYVIDASGDYSVVPIYLSYDNLVKKQGVKVSIKDFFTALKVSGADSVDIHEVNPIGTNTIYNLDYFIENGDIDETLAAKWKAWQNEIAAIQSYCACLSLMRSSAMARLSASLAEEQAINDEECDLENQRSTIVQQLALPNTWSVPFDETIRKQLDNTLKSLDQQIAVKKAEIAAKSTETAGIQSEIDNHSQEIAAIQARLKPEKYFKQSEWNTLSSFIIEDHFVDDTFAFYDVDISGSDDAFDSADRSNITLSGLTDDDFVAVDLSEADPEGIINKDIYLLNGGTVHLQDTKNGATTMDISARILSGTYERDKSTGAVVCSIYTGAGEITFNGESRTFGNANLSIVGTGPQFSKPQDVLSSRSVQLTGVKVYYTRNASPFESYATQQQLYDYAMEQHRKIAFPGCEFEIGLANLLFAKDYQAFRDVLRLGSGVYLELHDGTLLTPLLLEVHLSFEEDADFDLVFSNTFQRHDNVTNLKKLLEESRSASRTLDMAKYNYGAFSRTGAQSEVRKLFTQGLSAAASQILAGHDNTVIIDGAGIKVRSASDASAYIAINNGMIALMDDANEAKLAIGKFYDTGLGSVMYGVVAPNIVGTLLAGENLVIQSPRLSDDSELMYFTVDRDGVRLANGQFDIYQFVEYGGSNMAKKVISLDPALGILAGNLDNAIVYNSDGSVKGVKAGDSLTVKKLSDLSSMGSLSPNFWVDLDGNVFLKGTIYATNGEFSGVLNASTINGTLTAGANGGDIRGTSIHVGGPDFSNFIVDSNGNVTMNGSVSFGSNLSGDMANFVNNVTSYMENGDAEVTAWFYDEPPTLSNAPASSWTTNALKDEHIGDYYFDKKNDVAYRFAKKSDGTYAWVREANTATVEALRAAAKAQDTADGKRRTFVGSSNPTPPYDVGDLWTNGTDLKTCVMAKAKGQSYAASDWAVQVGYTNDDTANSIANGTYNGGTFIDKKTIYAPAIRGGATLGVGTNANAAKGYNLFVDSDGSIKLGANNNTASKYNFYVDKDGNVVMSGGITLAGNITWSSNTSLPNHVARVFTSTPTVPYSVGDIWADGSKLYKCKTAKTASQAYNITDWEEAVNYEGKDVVKNIVDGKYTGGTFINGTTISSPKIYGSAILGVGANGAGSSDESKNYNFYVDSSGNVTMRGGINLAGSITWSASNSPTRAVYAMSALAKPADGRTNFPASDTAGSATSTGQWHTTLSSDDYYVSYSYNGGATWTDAIRIRGSNATVTRDSIVTALRNATSGLPDGIYPYSYDDNGTTKYAIGINASYIRAGTIDADEITLSNKYGGLGVGRGSTGQRTTYGPMLYADENPSGTTRTTMDNAMHYAIATNAGVRLTADSGGADSSNIYVNDTYARMVTYRQTAVSIIDAADNEVQLLRRPNVSGWNYNNGDKCARIRLCNGGEGDPVYNLNDYVVVLRSQNKGDNNENLYRRIVVSSKYIFMDESTTITSDADAKNTISYDLDRYERFFMKLSPASFHYNQSSSGRFHTGFVAQQVESALDESGLTTKDFAGLVIHDQLSEEIEYKYGLRYEEFISLNTYMIQKLYARIEELENQIQLLLGGNE